MLHALGHTEGEALLWTRPETGAQSPQPSLIARTPGKQQHRCSCEVQTTHCNPRCNPRYHSLSKPLDQLTQHSGDWMAKLPQHCQRVMRPDANNLSTTAFLSPYSVPLHLSKGGSDTRLHCHKATKLHPTGCTGLCGRWVPSLCRDKSGLSRPCPGLINSTTTQSSSFIMKRKLCSNLSSKTP